MTTHRLGCNLPNLHPESPMREHLDHVQTTLTISKDNTLRVVLTEANHALVEAVDGWLYRGTRIYYSIHVTFNGTEWVQQNLRGVVHCPDASDKGEKIITAAVLSALNASVLRTEWFEKLRCEAQAHSASNDIMRADTEIAKLEDQLRILKSRRATLEFVESQAQLGNVPASYTEPIH